MSLESRLKKQATIIDTIDGFLGPATSFMYLSGSESLQSLATILSVAEVALLKVPFAFSYIAKTGDVSSLLYWVPKEFLANFNKYSGFLDIIPTYVLRVNNYLNKQKR